MASTLQRTATWLCLAVALLTGFAPVRGFVLCFEPSGAICLDLTTAEDTCGGCETSESDEPVEASHEIDPQDSCCSCLDLPIPGFSQDKQLQPSTIEFQTGPRIGGSLLSCLCAPPPVAAFPDERVEVPRPPGSIDLIRAVVLVI